MDDIKQKYEMLRKKYKLPLLEELVKEFPVKLDDPSLILSCIVEKICDDMSDHAQILESVIFVGSSSNPSTLYETNMLKDKKEKLFDLYKEVMSIRWGAEKVKNNGKEAEMASFIKNVNAEWTNKLKKSFVEICELFEKKWKEVKLRETSTELMYHG
jgi:hypothetical protein